jgi:UDP-glucose 4-epimerase
MFSSFRKELLAQYSNKKILITGGSGYLASNLAMALKDVECKILRLTRSVEKLIPIDGICEFVDVQSDLLTSDIWEETLENIDIVYHFAAQTSTYDANAHPAKDFQSNVLPMLELLKACDKNGWQPIVCFSGTVTEAGIPQSVPVDETHPDCPVTIYDVHKQMAENYLKYYARHGTVKGVTLRLPNVYGPGPQSSSADRGILNMMMRKALKGETLTVYGTGEYLRDYIHVDDVSWAFLAAPMSIDCLNGHHFVVGTGEGHTIMQAVNLIATRVYQKFGSSVSVISIDPPTSQSPIEFRNFIANSSKFQMAVEWAPFYSLTKGIDQTLDFFFSKKNK